MAKETDKRWKGRLIDWPTLSEMDTADYELKPLNQAQVAILLAALEPYRWGTRWIDLAISKDELELLISDIEYRLMLNEAGMEIIWDGCALKSVDGGIETTIVTAAEIQACMDLSGLSGGGGIVPKVYNVLLGANVTTTSLTFVHASQLDQEHTYTKSNALVFVSFSAQANQGQRTTFKMRMNNGSVVYGRDTIEQETFANVTAREIVFSDVFEDIPAGSHTLGIEWKVNAGTGVIFEGYNAVWTIIEFDDASDLFVEDIRIFEGELQKKIGGIWLNVTDSLEAILNSISATASAALAAAAAAQATADGAVTVNTSQSTQITALQTGLGDANLAIDALDIRLTSIEDVDIPQINTTLANHESRLDALEAASANLPWSIIFDFKVDDWDWVAAGGETWNSSNGWMSANGSGEIHIYRADLISDQRVTHMKLWWRAATGSYPQTYNAAFSDLATGGGLYVAGIGTLFAGWVKVPQNDGYQNCQIKIVAADGIADFQLEKVQFLGLGVDPFAGI